jgi:hypothetical protein
MILDEKLKGVIDQGAGTLTLFEPESVEVIIFFFSFSFWGSFLSFFQQETYPAAIEILKYVNLLVDSLHDKLEKVNAN